MSASCPRPSKEMMKIAYRILKTPKQLQQTYKSSKKESEFRVQRWHRESQGK
jgi:hypothetical protein